MGKMNTRTVHCNL